MAGSTKEPSLIGRAAKSASSVLMSIACVTAAGRFSRRPSDNLERT
jgi:hypothetical protein